jgi:hypothetical protein
MRGGKVAKSEGYFFARPRLDVQKPIRISAESIYHHNFRTLLAVLDNFQHSLTTQAAAAADVSQQYTTMAEQPPEAPAV